MPNAFRRRFLRFSLASLLIGITLVGLWLGPIANRVHHQERVIAEIERLGGDVVFDSTSPPGPVWLRNWLGDEYFRKVSRVNLDSSAATDALVEQIARLPDLDQLSLTQTEITDESLRHIARLKKLRALSVSFNEITDAGLVHLAPLDELIHLDLDVTSVTDQGLPALAQLPKLDGLKLYGNPITDEGAATLGEMRTLGSLDLGNTLITNDGLEHLAKLPLLRRLRLDQMVTGQGQELRIDDAGLRHIVDMQNLADLGLVNFPITDEGLQQLASMPKLSSLSLFGNSQVSSDGIARLKKAKPGLSIRQ